MNGRQTVLTVHEIEQRRAPVYRVTRERRVRTLADAVRFIDRVGFCWLFASNSGAPELPSLFEAVKGRRGASIFEWDADSDLVWAWKNELPAVRRAYYGKALTGRPALVSLEMLPFLLAALGQSGEQFKRAAAHGGASMEARRIYDTLERNGPMPTVALRSACGMGGKNGGLRYHRALDELQRSLLVMPVGATKEVGNWTSQIFELVERWFPEQVAASGRIDLTEARRELARRYLKTVVAARPNALARLFAMSREETAALIDELTAARALRLDGDWLVAARR